MVEEGCNKDYSTKAEEWIKQIGGTNDACESIYVSPLKSPLLVFATESDVKEAIDRELKSIIQDMVPTYKLGQNYMGVSYQQAFIPFYKPSPARTIIQPILNPFQNNIANYSQNQKIEQFSHKKINVNRAKAVNSLVNNSNIDILKLDSRKNSPQKNTENILQGDQEEKNNSEENKGKKQLQKLQELKNQNEIVQLQFLHIRDCQPNLQQTQQIRTIDQQQQQHQQHQQQQLLQQNNILDLNQLKHISRNQKLSTNQLQQDRRREIKSLKGKITDFIHKLNQQQKKKRNQEFARQVSDDRKMFLNDFNKQFSEQKNQNSNQIQKNSEILDMSQIYEGVWMDGIETEITEEVNDGNEEGQEEIAENENQLLNNQNNEDDEGEEKLLGMSRVSQENTLQNFERPEFQEVDQEVAEVLNLLDAELSNLQVDTSSKLGGQGRKKSNKVLLQNRVQKNSGQIDWAVKVDSSLARIEFEQYRNSMALTFDFELDDFQKAAVVHLEKGDSVFVSAHTSAGKTVVAEYAFALANRHNTRACYTSPIKTISNQKYRDFGKKGFNVGILTGDVQVNMDAPCLIMTTEILRSMLYKGADIVRDLEFVIFDEVHYVNDIDRGVVWEEVIIMLPQHVKIVLLSATVPNVMEFADWVGRTKQKQVYVVSAFKRPVPLQHYIFYNAKTYLVYKDKVFRSEGVREAQLAYKNHNKPPESKEKDKQLRPTGRETGQPGPNQQNQQRTAQMKSRPINYALLNARQQISGDAGPNRTGAVQREHINKLVQTLKQKDLLPAIVFVFSKKKIDEIADQLATTDLLNGQSEKSLVHLFCEKSLARLKDGDRRLPQIIKVRDLLKRGIGIHHAGLLPIMKEVVEMLFCRGLVRLLISTETFAMGVNAPARTVVFFGIKKHDGREHRYLLPGEYTQMAGRAGRRGLDNSGAVMVYCFEDVPGEELFKKLIDGSPMRLSSQFRLTYGMILNLLRVEDLKVEEMLRRSFAEFHAQRRHPETIKKAEITLKNIKNRPWPNDAPATKQEVEEYVAVEEQIQILSNKIWDKIFNYSMARNFLTVGRVVLVKVLKTGMTEPGVLLGSPRHLMQMNSSTDEDDSEEDTLMTVRRSKKKNMLNIDNNALSGVPLLSGDLQSDTLYVAVIHTRNPLDKHMQASSTEQLAPPVHALDESGLVLVKGKKNKGRSVQQIQKDVGTLPRYGTAAGVDYALLEISAFDIIAITKTMLSNIPPDAALRDSDHSLGIALSGLVKAVDSAAKKQQELAVMDPIKDFKMLAGLENMQDIQDMDRLIADRAAMPCHRMQGLGPAFAKARGERLLEQRIQSLKKSLTDEGLFMMPEFEKKTVVLKDLGYIDEDMVVQLKGRVACEINSVSCQVLATEMIFRGVLQNLSPQEAVAIISPLVFQEKSKDVPDLSTEGLVRGAEQLITISEDIADLLQKVGLQVTHEDYVQENLHFGLIKVVYEWAKGTPFETICNYTDVMEGSIVRTIVRLEQTCREMMDAARVMGNTQLYLLMEEGAQCIRRDVIFAASLYIAQ